MNQIQGTAKHSKARLIGYWVLTGYLAFESILSATWDFNWVYKRYAITMMQHLGFPLYFLVIKGVATLLSVPVIILPGMRLLKEWAYFGNFIIYIGGYCISPGSWGWLWNFGISDPFFIDIRLVMGFA